jgi:hypothetical protein
MGALDIFKNLNYTTHVEACYSGALRPPTKRSIGVAIRPTPNGHKPLVKIYIQPDLMKTADFHIGDRLTLSFTEFATHIKIEKSDEGVLLHAAANNSTCKDYIKAKLGTQYRARMQITMTDEFLDAFTFEDKCNAFCEPSYIRKGHYILAPLDDLPIFPAKGYGKKRKHTNPPEH